MNNQVALRQEAQLVLSVLLANHEAFKVPGQIEPACPAQYVGALHDPMTRLWVLVHQPDVTDGVVELGAYLGLPTPQEVTSTLTQWVSEHSVDDHDTLIAMLSTGDTPWVLCDGEIWV